MSCLIDNFYKFFLSGFVLIAIGFIITLSNYDLVIHGTIICSLGLFIVIFSLVYILVYTSYIEPYYNKKNKVIIHYNEAFNTDLILNKPSLEQETCSICLKNDNLVSKLKCCNHYAHPDCVKEWYKLNPTKKECFICRGRIESV